MARSISATISTANVTASADILGAAVYALSMLFHNKNIPGSIQRIGLTAVPAFNLLKSICQQRNLERQV